MINGHFERAEQAFKKAAELAPRAWEPHYNLGEIYMVAKLKDMARKEYEEAIQLNKGSFKPHNGLGLWFLKNDEVDNAIAEFTKASELAPDSPIPAFNLGLAFAKAKKNSQARKALSKVVSNPRAGKIAEEARKLQRTIAQS